MIIREGVLIQPLDTWIADLFQPEYRQATIAAMTVQAQPTQHPPQDDQTRQLINECKRKLHQYCKALDTGADPTVVSG